MRIAAIDIGTNSTRLLIADVAGDGAVRPIERLNRITRLGQGVDATRMLQPEAIERTVAVLQEYRKLIDEHEAERVRATATSASRDAGNRDDFFAAAEQATGVRPEVISGQEEAALSFRGATAGLHEPAPYLVLDIGGGSTEFIVGSTEPDGLISVDIGCVRLTERFLASDPPTPEELSVALSYVRDHFQDVEREVPSVKGARTLVGLAGTITTLAAVELGLSEYDAQRIHHFRLSHDAAEDVFRTLATEPIDQRRHNPGLDPGRVDVIVGGALVAVAVMRHFGFEEMLVSESDILDGLVRSLVRSA
jgi:exopolyphosphatase/guanosine-5'-triphosphate,3'-diphosphate pyrophosphatase